MRANTTIRFEAGGSHFAIDCSKVQRLVAAPRLSVPPSAPHVLAGFFSNGGELVCVLRFSALFDLPCRTEPALYDHVIILRGHEPRIALLVERVDSVFERARDDVKSLATGMSHRDCVTAEISHGGETIPLIDTDRLISEFERECVAHFLAQEQRRQSAFGETCE